MMLVGQAGIPTLYWPIFALVLIVLTLGVNMLVLVKQYKRCPPNRLLVIFGRTASGQTTQIVHGGARFVIPLLQDYRWLSLDPVRITISPPSEAVQESLGFQVPVTYIVAIGTAPELAQNAAARLLGLPLDVIEEQVRDMIAGELASVVDATLAGPDSPDREAFYGRLQSALESRIQPLGMELISMRREL